MNWFQGLLYDGKSLEPLPAQVNFMPAALHITYQLPEQALPVNQYWQVHRVIKENIPDSGQTRLRYGKFPGQTLEIPDTNFSLAFEAYYAPAPAANKATAENIKTPKRGLGGIYAFFILLLLLVPAIYFWVVPVAADFATRQISDNYEQKLGRQLANNVLAAKNIDSVKTATLTAFVKHLRLKAPAKLKTVVVQHPVPNAFAIPGGTIVVHHAMLPLLKSSEELAALMGHEYAHIKHRHSLRTLVRSLSGYILISFVFGDVSALSAIILQNAQTFNSLLYSRQFEKEADESGLEVLRQRRLNPYGMVWLFQHLQKQNPEQERQNEYISSHPLLSARIANIRKLIRQNPYEVQKNDSLAFYFKKLKEK